MNILDSGEKEGGDYQATMTDEVGRMLTVSITDEGVILDAYVDDGDTLVGTIARTFDEWHEVVRKGDTHA